VIVQAPILAAVTSAALAAPGSDPVSHPGGSKSPGAHKEAR
jgi:hypothetical protein